MTINLKIDTPKTVWYVYRSGAFTVEIAAWRYTASGDEWTWGVYAHIFDTHPKFNDPRAIYENAPFHGGCTFEARRTHEPALGYRYDWQKMRETLVFGSDYAHYGDDYYQRSDPKDGIPGGILSDAESLVRYLNGGQP